MSQAQGYISSIYSLYCDMCRVGSQEQGSRKKPRHCEKFRRIFVICRITKQLETLFVFSQKLLRITDLTGNRPLEVLSRRLWWMPSAISMRLEIWRISTPSSRTQRPLSLSVGHLFSHPLTTRYVSESSL